MKHTRRDAISAMLAGAAALGGYRIALANTDSQLPTTSQSGFRSGPLGPSDAVQTLASERPITMTIVEAEVDSEVEVNQIVEGQMLNPTGPWVVSWYEGTGMMHEKRRNMLFSGHVDYWDVGPAIFWTLADVPEGTEIHLIGENGGEASYAVEFIERVTLAELTPEKMREITAPTPYEALTIITCGGEFDYNAGAYLQRDIVRARLVQGEETGTRIGEEDAAPADEIPADSTPAAESAPADAAAAARIATVTQDNVNVRPEPSTDSTAVASVAAGATVTITGDPVEGGDYSWYPVILEDGTAGFIVVDFLELEP